MSPKLPKGEQPGYSDGPPQDVRIVGPVTLSRPDIADTADQPLWSVIETGALSLEFQKFDAFISDSFCTEGASPTLPTEITGRLPFPDLESYKLLKAAAELFMLTQVGVLTGAEPPRPTDFGDIPAEVLDEASRCAIATASVSAATPSSATFGTIGTSRPSSTER